MSDTQIGRYFKEHEMECKCRKCLKTIFDANLIRKLDALREDLGRPVTITSGYRCEAHNRAVGGSPNSQHLLGKAADIAVYEYKLNGKVLPRMTAAELLPYAEKHGFDGIGLYSWGLHVDVRGYKARWDFR